MTGKLWAVVRREYLERVRSKGFIIGTVLGPVLMGLVMVLPLLLAGKAGKPLRVAVLDATGVLQRDVEKALTEARRDDNPLFDVRTGLLRESGGREEALRKSVLQRDLDGFLLLPEDAMDASTAYYYGRTLSNQMDIRMMRWILRDVVISHRLGSAGLDRGQVERLTRDMELRTIRLSEQGDREGQELAIIYPLAMLLILYASILMWGQLVMTSIIEEKGGRVIELVASGVGPGALLSGKLLGVGAAGLTQFLVWSISLAAVSVAAGGPLIGRLPTPDMTPMILGSFIIFFLLGFTFYSALYAAIGASVNTVQEAQNFVFPVIVPLILGLALFPVVVERPDGHLAVVLSLIPFLSPLLMFLRIAILTPPWWQIVLSLLLLCVAVLAVLWISAKIYRVGILMYGKRPTLPELRRWLLRA